jgi:light-regulated signal transduction histidine kinase (bacteriophytochrome)
MVIGADKMAALIDDLLKLSRVSLREICRTEIDLRPIALEIIKVLQQNNPERMVEVTIGEQLIVRADRNLTAIALTNLIRNAWKFTSKISHPFIEINATEKHDGKVFFVRDNGAGFDMSQTSRLFQPFQRLHSEAEFPGTGIGLTVVKRVIDKHGGAIWVESEPDKGTTFYFTFPQ